MFKRSSSARKMPAMPKLPSFKREKSLTKGLKGILKKTASGLTPRSSSFKTSYSTSSSTLSPSSSTSSSHAPALSPPVTTSPTIQDKRSVAVKPIEDKVPAIMVEEEIKRKEEVAMESKPVADLSVPTPEVLPSVEIEDAAEDLSEKAVVAVESVEKVAVADEVCSTSDLTDISGGVTEMSKEDVESVEEVVSEEVEAVEEVEKQAMTLVENKVETVEMVVSEAMEGLKSVDQATSMQEVVDKVDVAHEVEVVKDVASDVFMKVKPVEEEEVIQVVVGPVVDEVMGGVTLMDKAATTTVEAPQDDEEEEEEDDQEDMPITQQGGAQGQYMGVQDYEPSMEEDDDEEEEREDKEEDEDDVVPPVVVEEEAVVAAPVANPSREPTPWSLGLLVVLPVIVSSVVGAYLSGRVNLKLDEIKVELPTVPFELPAVPFELPAVLKVELPPVPFELPAVPFLAPAAPVVPKDTPFLIRSEDGMCFNGKKFADCSKSGKFTLFPEDDYSSEEGGHIRFADSERCLTVKYKGLFKKRHVVKAGKCSAPESQGWHFNDGVLCHNGLCLSHKGSKPLLVQASGDRLELVMQQPTETEDQDTTLSFDSFDFTRSAF